MGLYFDLNILHTFASTSCIVTPHPDYFLDLVGVIVFFIIIGVMLSATIRPSIKTTAHNRPVENVDIKEDSKQSDVESADEQGF